MDRILLVNDSESILERTAKILDDMGWDVSVASSRDSASAACVAFRPHFAVVDVEMLGGDGFEAISILRRADKNLFILAVTRGRNDALSLKVAKACGANDYLIGPISATKLSAAIDVGLDRSHSSPTDSSS